MSYTKLFSSLVTSTIWTEDDRTRIVWITMLAIANQHGEIQASIPGLARIAGVPVGDCKAAIEKFLSPDEFSRTPDDEGRRIEKIDGGWALLNHLKYREMASREESKSAAAERQKRYRARKARNMANASPSVTDHNEPVTNASRNSKSDGTVTDTLHIAEAEAEAERERESKERPPARDEFADEFSDDYPTATANRFAEIQRWVNSLHPSWKKRPSFTRIELDELQSNAKILCDLTDDDLELVRAYMAALIPSDWGKFWQPNNRGMFLKSISDVLTHADRWKSRCKREGVATGIKQSKPAA